MLARAAGLAAAGLAIDQAGTGRLLAAVQRAAPAVDWQWSGAITAGSARIRARVTIEGPVRLLVTHADGRDAAAPKVVTSTGPPSTDGVHTFDADGLQPDTAYRYVVETAAGRDERAGHFRTFGDGRFSFAFAFGSCASTGSNNLIFDTMRRRAPHFFLHLGDFHYANIGVDDPWRFRDASNRVLRSPRQSALYREAPIVYVFDDHDFGTDDSDGTSITRGSAQRVYRERVPHYPLPLSAVPPDAPPGTGLLGPIAHAFTVGRARVIVTDTRSERTPQRARDAATRTMLGPAQRQWFVERADPRRRRQGGGGVLGVHRAVDHQGEPEQRPRLGAVRARARRDCRHHLQAGPDVAPDHPERRRPHGRHRRRHQQQLRGRQRPLDARRRRGAGGAVLALSAIERRSVQPRPLDAQPPVRLGRGQGRRRHAHRADLVLATRSAR